LPEAGIASAVDNVLEAFGSVDAAIVEGAQAGIPFRCDSLVCE
jgi:hypothetical protein